MILGALITCIGCGCDDDSPCVTVNDVACFWIRKDEAAGVGVCSHCPDDAARFDDSDRTRLDDEHDYADDDSTLLLPGDDDFDATLELLD